MPVNKDFLIVYTGLALKNLLQILSCLVFFAPQAQAFNLVDEDNFNPFFERDLSLDSQQFDRSMFYPHIYQLDNGLTVVLQERAHSNAVAFRIVVGVGFRDFPCGDRETPHLLEHMMFAGTDRFTEIELDNLVYEIGGTWNATTDNDNTIYMLDTYKGYWPKALEILHHIFTRSEIAEDTLSGAIDIVHRESAHGVPSKLEQTLYKLGWGVSEFDKLFEVALPGTNHDCRHIESAEHITQADLLTAFDDFYTPENMTLIVVGGYQLDDMQKRINETFGDVKPTKGKARIPTQFDAPVTATTISGSISNIIGKNGFVNYVWRLPGPAHRDFPALVMLSEYLDITLYNKIRVESALSYAPESYITSYQDYSFLVIGADVALEELQQVDMQFEDILETLYEDGITQEELESMKKAFILSFVSEAENTSDLSRYYADWIPELHYNGQYFDYIKEVEAMTLEDVNTVIVKYLSRDHRIKVIERPILHTNHMIIGLVVLIGALFMFVYWFRRKAR